MLKSILLGCILIRISLSMLPPFEIDQNDWRYWSQRMVEVGPNQFYSGEIFTDYTPGFLYILWIIGSIKNWLLPDLGYATNLFDLMLKIPANLFDILSGLLIYSIVRRKLGERWGITGFLLYVLNPALFFNSSVWGQFDGISTFFLLLALLLILYKRLPELGAFLFAFALAFKPQAIFFTPALGMLLLLNERFKRLFFSFFVFSLASIAFYLPFFPDNPVEGIVKVNQKVGEVFSCTTCFAYNFWGIFGNWKHDLVLFFNVPKLAWGIILLLSSFIPILFLKPFFKRYREPYIYLTISLVIFAFFTLLTRMHERYLFPFFGFFLTGALLLKSTRLIIAYILISIISFVNLYHAYSYYNYVYTNKLNLFRPPLIEQIMENFNIFSALSFSLFILLLIYFVKMMKNWK